ncbi:hypothetical protein AB1E18_015848 [Capra hircus]
MRPEYTDSAVCGEGGIVHDSQPWSSSEEQGPSGRLEYYQAGPVSVAGSATGGFLGVRGNAFRLEQLPARLRPHWLFARGCRTEAAADWLAVPTRAERYWVSGRWPDDPPEDRELPVRVVSGGPGAGGDCDLTAARTLPALFACICLPVSQVPSERAVPWTVLTAPS